jgi:hypothetical protein
VLGLALIALVALPVFRLLGDADMMDQLMSEAANKTGGTPGERFRVGGPG